MPHKSIVYADDLNRATETALRHRFSCAAANGARLQQSSVTASEAQPPLDHRSSRRERRTPFASYAAGGVYGFSGAALDLIVEGRERPASPPPPPSCLHEAAAAVQRYKASGHRIAHSAEDELIGLCMHLHRVPLVQCGCFYQYGPCDVYNWTTCRDGTPESRLCRLPLSVHKIRKVGWYRPWFSQLLAREPVHLAELLARSPPGPASQRAEPH